MRALSSAVLLLCAGCTPTVSDALPVAHGALATGTPPTPPTRPVLLPTVSPVTALVTLALHPDGTAEVEGLTAKPIAFRERHLIPYEPARHRPVAGARTSEAAGASYVLVVSAPQLSEPRVVPLELGQPGEGGGDVADRWQHGSVIVRAPFFGDRTSVSLLRLTAQGTVELAASRATP